MTTGGRSATFMTCLICSFIAGSSEWIEGEKSPLSRATRARGERPAKPAFQTAGGGRARRGDEDGVVSGDGAGDVGETGLVDSPGDRVGAGGRRSDDHERAGCMNRQHREPETLIERLGAPLSGYEERRVAWRRVAGGRAGQPEVADVPRERGLGDREASPAQQGLELFLRADGPAADEPQDLRSPPQGPAGIAIHDDGY